jgi:hypothetical protein
MELRFWTDPETGLPHIYLKVVYVPDKGANSAFVVTAYELVGKVLKAYRRAKRRYRR